MKKFLFVMDPVETLNMETETSLLLMKDLMRRGHQVFWLEPAGLSLLKDQPLGTVSAVHETEPPALGKPFSTNLNSFDAVVIRKDPPFDTGYLQLTLVLDYLDQRVVQFNNAKALRDFNEKMLPLRWPEFTPPTLISMDPGQIGRFADIHGAIVLKPLHDCSGRGVIKIEPRSGEDTGALIERALTGPDGKSKFLVAQKFLSSVAHGDKRVYLVNGVAVGAVNRIPQPESFLANIHQGAVSVETHLSPWEKHIIESVAPFLVDRGIFLAGADFIGGYLTELNITSPSAIRQINAVSGVKVHRLIVDAMLEKTAGPLQHRVTVTRRSRLGQQSGRWYGRGRTGPANTCCIWS